MNPEERDAILVRHDLVLSMTFDANGDWAVYADEVAAVLVELETAIETARREGRKAGLREAAELMENYDRRGDGMYLRNRIESLIDSEGR